MRYDVRGTSLPSYLIPHTSYLIVLLAFVVRVYNLPFESLDIDEADIVAFARLPIADLAKRLVQPGENGPLYIILLRGWGTLAGESEFALRFFSVIPSVLSVPIIAMLGRRLLSPAAGIAAAALLAVSTYELFYAQMVKMYSLLLLLTLLSCWLLLRALERPSAKRWAGYTLATALAMQIHVFGVLLLPWHALYFVLTRMARPHPDPLPAGEGKRGWGFPLVSLAVLTLPYLPVAIARLGALRAPETLTRQFTGPRDPLGMLATLAREYGTRFDQLPGELLTAVFVAFTISGFAAVLWGQFRVSGFGWDGRLETRNSKPETRNPGLLLGLGLAVPVILTYGFVTLGAPLFSSRYLLLTLPVFYLAWAAIVAALWGRWRTLGASLLAVFLLVNGARWWQTAVQGERFREDWRSAVAYLEQRQQSGEPVLVLHDASFRAVDYYRREPMLLTSLERGPEQPPDLSKAPPLAGQSRAWLLAAYFEAGDLTPVESWLNERAQLASKAWLPGVMVSEYRAE